LAFARTLHRRCKINKESTNTVASQLSLDPLQVRGVVRLLMAIDYIPSPERLALVAMLDQGLDDEDIAEMWLKSVEWARAVRDRADELREREPIKKYLEEMRGWHDPTDPSPHQIWKVECQRFLEEKPRGKVGGGVMVMEA
jgi:hypothetical protein